MVTGEGRDERGVDARERGDLVRGRGEEVKAGELIVCVRQRETRGERGVGLGVRIAKTGESGRMKNVGGEGVSGINLNGDQVWSAAGKRCSRGGKRRWGG